MDFTTNGQFQLDNFYPYPTAYGGDHPESGFTRAYSSLAQQDSFEDWVMWKAPGDSIPVPILYWTWNWSASASWVHGAATVYAASPTAVQVINATLTDSYPFWDKVLTNT